MDEEEKRKRREYYALHKKEIREKLRLRRATDPIYYQRLKEHDRKYREKHKDAINKRYRDRYAANPGNKKESFKRYQSSHKWKFITRNAERKKYIKQRTPKWADKRKIAEFYKLAEKMTKDTGREHHVDHIFPLRGKMGSGLHVHTNLRVIPAVENIKKKNIWPVELACAKYEN